MADNEGIVAAQQQQNGQQATTCTGDCRRCFPMQRAYCASQLSLNNMRVLDNVMRELLSLKENLGVMSNEVKDIGEKVKASTKSEGMLIAPEQKSQEPSSADAFFSSPTT